MSLLHVLRAYEDTLQQRGISPDDDTYYYRFLLKLSLDGNNDWFKNFEAEKRLNQQKAVAEKHTETATMKAALETWRAASGAHRAIELVESPRSDRFQMNGQYDLAPAEALPAAAVNGPNGHTHRSSPPRPSRSLPQGLSSPGSPSRAILQDLSDWVGSERDEWNHSPLRQRQSPVGDDAQGAVPRPIDKGSAGSSTEQNSVGEQVDLNRRASWGRASPTNATGLRNDIPPNSPEDVAAYHDFKGLSDAFRVWAEHMLSVRAVREEKARALELYIDALDSWARKVSKQTLIAWRGVINSVRKARRHVLMWAWRRFSAAHQVLRLRLAQVADALYHWQSRSFRSTWLRWKLMVTPPLRQVHPLLVLGILMLRRQGRPRWMSTVDATKIGAYDGDVSKVTHRRRLERGQHALRTWYAENLFRAWVQHTDVCFAALDRSVRHWAGRSWARHFLQWRHYTSAVRHRYERMAAAENHASTQNVRTALRAWHNYITRLFTMRKKVAQFTTVTRLLGMAPYLQEWASHCRAEEARRSALVWTFRSRVVRGVFVVWRKHTGNLAQRSAAVRAIQKMRHVHAFEHYLRHWATWAKWRTWCSSTVAAGRRAVSRSLQRKIFSRWCTFRMETLQLRSAMNIVLKRWALIECAMALQQWMYVCELKRKGVMQFAKYLVNATRFYFTFWGRWASRMKRVARTNATRVVRYARVIFDTWNVRTMKKIQLKEQVLKLMGFVRTTVQQRCFQSWKYHCKLRVLHREIVAERLTAKKSRVELVTFEYWRGWAKRHSIISTMLNNRFVQLAAASKMERFGRWRWYVSMEQTGRAVSSVHAAYSRRKLWMGWQVARKVEGARKVCQPIYKRQLLNKWRAWTKHSRRITKAVTKIVSRRERALKRSLLRNWLAYLDLLDEQAAMATHCAAAKAFKRLFPVWAAFARESSAIKSKLGAVLLSKWMSSSRQLFEYWRAYATHRAAKRHRTLRATMYRWSSSVARALYTWQSNVAAQVQQARKIDAARYMAEQHTQSRAFDAWARFLKLRQKVKMWLEKAHLFNSERTWVFVQKVVREWIQFTKDRGAQQLRKGAALRFWIAFSLGPAMRGWKGHTARIKLRKEVLAASIAKWDPSAVGTVQMSDMVGFGGYKAATTGVMAAVCRHLLRSCVDTWTAYIMTRRQVRNVVFQLGRGQELRLLKSCLDSWHVRVAVWKWVCNSKIVADQHWYYKVPFNRWALKVNTKKRLHDSAAICEAQRRSQVRRRYLQLWSARYVRRVGLMALRHSRCISVQQQVLEAWSVFATASAALNSKLKSIMAKWRSKAVLECFWCWTTFALLSKQMKIMVTRADHFLRPRMLHFLWEHFLAGVHAIRAKRNLMLMAFMHVEQQQSKRIVTMWQEWVARKLRRRELLKVAELFFLRRELQRWKEWTRIKVALAEKTWMALKYLSNDSKRRMFTGWKQTAATQTRLRMTMRKILARQINILERATFSRWRNLMYAAQLYDYLAQKRAIIGWYGVVERERKMRLVLRVFMNKVIARAFGSWRARVNQSQAVDSLRADINGRIIRQLFNLWQHRCKQQIMLRIFASRTVLGFLTMCWGAFREGVAMQAAAELHLQQAVCKLLREAWFKCCARQAWRRWAHYAHICAISQRLQIVSADKILRHIVSGWQKFVAKQVRLRQIAAQVLGKIHSKWISKAWNSWEDYTKRSVKVKTFAIGLLTSAIQGRFDRWSRYTNVCLRRSKLVEAGVARRRALTLASHVHKWFTLAKLLQRVAHLIGKRQDVTTRKVFTRWVTKIGNKIEMRMAIASMETEIKLRPVCSRVALECAQRWATLGTGIPFAHWARVWQIKKTRKAAQKIGLMNHFASYRRRCFASWAFSVELQKKGMLCIAKLRSKVTKQTFDMWCDRVEYDRLLRIKLRDAMVHQETFLHRMTFALWRRQVRLSQGVLFMLHHRAYRYVTQAFGQWSIQTVIWANKSHKDLRARCHWALALLFGTFSSWAEGVAAIRMAKHFLSLHKLHLDSVRLDQHLRAWHRTASRRHYLRTASIWMWARNYQARYLTGWLLVVASSIAMKRKVLLAIMNVRRRHFMQWKQVARRRAGIVDVTMCWWMAFSLRTCFNEWTRHVSLRKMYLVIDRQFYEARKPQILYSHLRHWQFTVEAEIKFRQIMSHFAPVRNLHGLLAHFQAWWKMTGIVQRDRIVKAEIENLHADYVQGDSLWRWRQQYKLKVGFRRHRYKYFCLEAIRAWHIEAIRSAKYKAAVYRLINRGTYSAFLQWGAHVAEKKRLNQLATKLMTQFLHGELNKAILRWRQYAVEHIHLANCLSKAVSTWTLATRCKAFKCMVQYTADRRHLHGQVDTACGHYNKNLLEASSREFFALAAQLVRASNLLRRRRLSIYSVVWGTIVNNQKKKSWAKSLILKFRPVILRRCVRCWILGNVLNRLEYDRDDHDKDLNAEICALVAEGDRKAARSLAIHRNLISRWQMKYYVWVFEVLGERLAKRLGCQRVLRRMLNMECEAAFHRWKGLTIAIYRGRELKAWRDIGRVAEGFEAWRWLHGKILAVNAGVVRRALHNWHHRIVVENLHTKGLLSLCSKYDQVLHRNAALHARLVRKALRAWRRVAAKATSLAKAELNALRVLSGYRLFIVWQRFSKQQRSDRATCNSYARHYDRALLRSALSAWRILRGHLNGDKILLRCFSHTNSFLRKRLAVERWKLYVVVKHRIYAHRALVLRFRRQRQMQTRASIARERARQFWNARNDAYDKWKRDKKTSMPAMWNTGASESPRHLISSLTSEHVHPLENASPGKKLFEDGTASTGEHSFASPRRGSGRMRSATMPSPFTNDRTSLSVPKVSDVEWIQQEFENDIKDYKQKQEEDLNDIIKAMKRADVLLLVDMWTNTCGERLMRLPFAAWKDLVRVFSTRACRTKLHDLQFVQLKWKVGELASNADHEYHRLNQVRTAFAFWLIRLKQNKIRRFAGPHKARMNSTSKSVFLRSGSRVAALSTILRSWTKLTAHSNRTMPVLEEQALRYYQRVGRRNLLRCVWAVWAQLHLHFTIVRHIKRNVGGLSIRAVFGSMWRYVLSRRLKHQREVWAADKRKLHQARTSFISWRVLLRGRKAKLSIPNNQSGLRLVPMDQGDSLGLSVASVDEEHELFVQTTTMAGRRLAMLG